MRSDTRTTPPAREPAVLTRGQGRAILTVVGLALMMVVSAVSGLNVALPELQRDLGASATEVHWIVDAYTLVFAGLLLFAGAVGDRFGRKPVLLAGILVFGLSSAVGMTSEDPTTLIAARALMGVGAAAVMPVTLSVITSSFPPEQRARAVGVWVGIAGGGAVIGLYGSGILLEFFSWSSVFALNIALAVMALLGTATVIPNSRDDHPPSLDALGGLLSLLVVGGLVFGFIEGPVRGWSEPVTITAFAVGILAAAAFVAWEARLTNPMLDPRLFRLRGFSTGALSMTVQFFASFGFFYIILQYLQYVAGLSPLESALALTPMPLVIIPLARQAPLLAERFGANRIAAVGLALSAAGMLALTFLQVDFTYWHLALALAVFAAGSGLASTPATVAITSALPPSKQGVGSAVNDVSREFGSALGIAILGGVLNGAYRSGVSDATDGLPAEAQEVAESSLPAAQQLADRMGAEGAGVLGAAQQAFVDASGSAFVVGAVVLACTAAVVLWLAPADESPTEVEMNQTGPTEDASTPHGAGPA